MKKRNVAAFCLIGAVLIGGGCYGGYRLVLKNTGTVEVVSVSGLNSEYFNENGSGSGVITSKANQNIYLDSEGLVQKVYVKPGDKVKIGDKLLSYDTTLAELELEESRLKKEAKELELKGAEADLKKLRSITPVPDTGGETSILDDLEEPELPDEEPESEEARAKIRQNGTVMTASQGVIVIGGEDSGVEVLPSGPSGDGGNASGNGDTAGTSTPELPAPEPGGNAGETITPGGTSSPELPVPEPDSSAGEPVYPGGASGNGDTAGTPAPGIPAPEPGGTPGDGGAGTPAPDSPTEEPDSPSGEPSLPGEPPSDGGLDGMDPPIDLPNTPGEEPGKPPIQVQPPSGADPVLPIDPEPSPLGRIQAYRVLNYQTEPYKGEGTKEKPYVFFCKDGAVIRASFMNRLLGYNEKGNSRKNGGMKEDGEGCYAILEIREGDDISGGFVKSIQINGTVPADKAFSPDITWTFTTGGLEKNIPVIIEETPPADDGNDYLDPGFQNWDDGDVYTVSELKKAIREKEQEIGELKLEIREEDLAITKNQRKLEDSTVTSSIHGVVKAVGELKEEQNGEPFIQITSDSGLYVRGTVDEFSRQKVGKGNTVTGYSYDSQVDFQAEITEISSYPTAASDGFYTANPNASSYPYLAYIEKPDGLEDGEYVSIQMEQGQEEKGGLYLPKAYVRSDNGQSYVYMEDGQHRLKKQYVRTGKVVDGGNVEIKSGLTLKDKIAFPYSNKIREGARTREKSGEDGWQEETEAWEE